MARCVFCENELSAATKPEHILLNALGGRKTTRNAICSDCNNRFGGTVDDILAQQAAVVRNMLQLKSGTGNAPPMLRNLQAGQERININSDGQPVRLGQPFDIVRDASGKVLAVKGVETTSAEDMRRLIPHLAAMLNLSEEKVREIIAASPATFISKRPDKSSRLRFGGEAMRSVTKSCLVLIAAALAQLVRTPVFAEARDFVLNGAEKFLQSRVCVDSRALPIKQAVRAKFGPFFNLIYVQSDANGRVIGHFTLLNAVAWQIVLAEAGGPPNLKLVLVSNPEDNAVWSDDASQISDVDMAWLETPQRSNAASLQRIEAIVAHHVKVEGAKAIDHIINQVRRRYAKDDEAIPPEQHDAFEHELADRLARHALALPYERELSPEEVAALAQPKSTQS
ncbi:MAG: HNH endonuclease [Caulobacteraceae bacterium]|nr:HNH endonuclease [Caulobacteraceae bacterium]